MGAEHIYMVEKRAYQDYPLVQEPYIRVFRLQSGAAERLILKAAVVHRYAAHSLVHDATGMAFVVLFVCVSSVASPQSSRYISVTTMTLAGLISRCSTPLSAQLDGTHTCRKSQ